LNLRNAASDIKIIFLTEKEKQNPISVLPEIA